MISKKNNFEKTKYVFLLALHIFAFSSNAQIRTRFASVLNFPSDARFVAMGGDAIGSLESHTNIFDPLDLTPNYRYSATVSSRPPNWNSSDWLSFFQGKSFVKINEKLALGGSLYSKTSGTEIGFGDGSPTFKGNTQEYQLFGQIFFRIDQPEEKFSLAVAFKRYKAGNTPFVTYYPFVKTDGRTVGIGNWIDIAGKYKIPFSTDSSEKKSSLHIIAAITNIGSKIEYSDGISFEIPNSAHLELAFREERFLSKISEFEVRLSYRNVLNSGDKFNKTFWRVGGEVGFSKLFFVRTGLHFTPYSSLFGMRQRPIFSYGVGFNFMVAKNAYFNDMNIRIDAAFVPVQKNNFPSLYTQDAFQNYAISFGISY